jgi:hypothetical protein
MTEDTQHGYTIISLNLIRPTFLVDVPLRENEVPITVFHLQRVDQICFVDRPPGCQKSFLIFEIRPVFMPDR